MMQELKIKIEDYKELEEKLKEIGAEFSHEVRVKDTYLNSPEDQVFKISESNGEKSLIKLKKENGKFNLVSREEINDEEIAEEVKTILKKKMRYWDYKELVFNINLIENVGEFLIVEAENPTKEIIIELLGIQNPEYIEVSFDKLKT